MVNELDEMEILIIWSFFTNPAWAIFSFVDICFAKLIVSLGSFVVIVCLSEETVDSFCKKNLDLIIISL